MGKGGGGSVCKFLVSGVNAVKENGRGASFFFSFSRGSFRSASFSSTQDALRRYAMKSSWELVTIGRRSFLFFDRREPVHATDRQSTISNPLPFTTVSLSSSLKGSNYPQGNETAIFFYCPIVAVNVDNLLS